MERTLGAAPALVLVVDDNAANRDLARETLEDEGYEVVVAENGAEAVAAFEARRPACVLMDVRMPTMDGLEACTRIRALAGGADVPVIFLTALRDVDTFDRAIEVGGDDFLGKPVRPAELLVRVSSALELRRMRVELGAQYELLRGQRDHLMRAQLMKERLMAFVVHDLKNPVASMDVQAQMLLRDKGISASSRAMLTQMRAEAKNLTRMIGNLLDIAKADEGKLSVALGDVDVVALVAGVVAEIEPVAEARGVSLSTDVGPSLARADADLLRRVLVNLVENAVRHTPKGREVGIVARAEARSFVFEVTDAGPGVADAMRTKIFDPFVQLDGSASHASRGGRGLGLAFCKLAVVAHGGTIEVVDREGEEGAVFRLSLPLDLPSFGP